MHTYTKFAKGVGLSGVTYVLVSVSGILVLPILTKTLSPGDYGAYVQVYATTQLLAFPLTIGLPIALVRFVGLSKKRQNVQEDFYSMLFFVLLVNLFVSLILFSLSKPLAHYLFNGNLIVAQLLPFVTLFASLDIFLIDFFRAFRQINWFAFLLFAQTYIGVALISYLVLSGYGVVGAVLGLLMANLILFLATLCFIVARIGFRVPHMTRLRTYLSFSAPLAPSNLSSSAVNTSDRYFIGIFLGATYVAYYAPSYTLGILIQMLAVPFNSMLAASLPKHHDDANVTVVETMLKYALKYFLAVAIPCIFILSILSKSILLALSTPEIASNGYFVTPFIAVSALLWGAEAIFSQVLILQKKTKIIGILWAASALINVGLNIVLIPLIGILGAAITTLLSFSFIFVAAISYSRRYMKFDLNPRFICKSAVASLVMIPVIHSLDLGSTFSTLIAASAGVIVYVALIFLMKGFEKDELTFFLRLFLKSRG